MIATGIVTIHRDVTITIPGIQTAADARAAVAAWLTTATDRITAVGETPAGWTVTVAPPAIPSARVDLRPNEGAVAS